MRSTAVTAIAAACSLACLWDRDTLREESLGAKDIAAVVNGDLGKHSPAFYEAKVTYTRALVDKGTARKERYDDLAVALARTGKLDEAIAVLAEKETKFPGEYTTEANLGTFLAMKGDLDGAIQHLEAGIKINPDAHFGREKYQVQLLRQAKAAKAAGAKVDPCANLFGVSTDGEDAMWVERPGKVVARDDVTFPPDDAAVAMVGLIRFGTADASPAVWFNLGVALAYQGHKHLAVRALHRAETLGHPCAATFGTPLAQVVPEYERARGRAGAWGEAVTRADADWKKGSAADARRQKAEDRLVSGRKYKKAFGF
jgi:tetratricopeptide (TPR) repeat protein